MKTELVFARAIGRWHCSIHGYFCGPVDDEAATAKRRKHGSDRTCGRMSEPAPFTMFAMGYES